MKFKVGDVCELLAPDQPEFHLRECTVVALPEWMDDVFDASTGEPTPPAMYYTIDIANDAIAYAMEHELRLKRPPSWDEWIFNTSEVRKEAREPVPMPGCDLVWIGRTDNRIENLELWMAGRNPNR